MKYEKEVNPIKVEIKISGKVLTIAKGKKKGQKVLVFNYMQIRDMMKAQATVNNCIEYDIQ